MSRPTRSIPPAQRRAHPPGHGARPSSVELALELLLIAGATVLVYSNTFDASFHFDDVQNIVQNERVHDLGKLWPPSGARWLGELSFALNYRFGGLHVIGYHAVNLLIHICNGLLVFALAKSTLRTPSLRDASLSPLVRRYVPLASGLLFALHPVQTQAVTYVVQRFASLATFFYLLSVVLYVRSRLSLETERAPKGIAACAYALSIVAAAAAMKTKEISFTLPITVAGYELLLFGTRRRLRLVLPFAATALLVAPSLAPARPDALGVTGHFAAETAEISRWTYLLTQSRVLVTYVRLLFFPVGQNLDYDFRLSSSVTDPDVLLAASSLLVMAGFAVVVLIRARRSNRADGVLAFFGIAWFFLTSSVESSVIPIRDVIYEHRMYLPSAGAAVALGTGLLAGVDALRFRSPVGLRVSVALLIATGPLGIATYARNFVWRDEASLWSDVAAKSPNKARVRYNLGHVFQDLERLDDAVREYRQAIRLDPGFPDPHTNLCNLLQDIRRWDEAVGECLAAIRLAPQLPNPHYNLGNVHRATGRLEDAASEYREAIRLDPSMAVAHNNLGGVYELTRDFDRALLEYREAARLAPDSADAHYNLAYAYQVHGDLDGAEREYRETLRLDPMRANAHADLGNVYRLKGRLDDAAREHHDASRLRW